MQSNYFVNPRELFSLVCEYQDTNNKKTYEKIIKQYVEMVRRYLMKHQFNKYDDSRKAEMTSVALYNFCKQGHKFNRELSHNAFSYYTQMIKNSIFQALNDHNYNEQHESKITYIEQFDAPTDLKQDFVEIDGDYETKPVSSNLFDDEESAKCRMKNSFKNKKVFKIEEMEKFNHFEKYYYSKYYSKDSESEVESYRKSLVNELEVF